VLADAPFIGFILVRDLDGNTLSLTTFATA
jgi:hypothetical protein